jgi:hypothetical protein
MLLVSETARLVTCRGLAEPVSLTNWFRTGADVFLGREMVMPLY